MMEVDDIQKLQDRAHLDKTIRQLQKQLDASKENAERWKLSATQGDVRPGSQYRQEIVALKQMLEEKDDIIQQRDATIENLTSYLHNPSSQDTSVCSSLLDEMDTPQSQEMERLLKENSNYAHRLIEQEAVLAKLQREKVEGERERVSLRKKVAALTYQHTSEQKEAKTIKKESMMLEKQVSALQQELSELRTSKGTTSTDENDSPRSSSTVSSTPFDVKVDPEERKSKIPKPGNVYPPSSPRESMRNMKRIMELQNEVRKVRTEKDSGLQELYQVREDRDSLRKQLAQLRETSDNEIKTLRNDLWKAKLLSESMEDMIAELDQAKFMPGSQQRQMGDKADSLKLRFREMNQTITRLQSEIRKRDARIFELEQLNDTDKQTETFLSVQRETRSLKMELDGALVDLEKASTFCTDQQKKFLRLRNDLRAKNETIMKLQRDLKSRTDSLVKARRELMEHEKKIETLESSQKESSSRVSDEIDNLRKKVVLRDEENQRLQQDLLSRGNSLTETRLELAEKNSKIKELEENKKEVDSSLVVSRSIDFVPQQDLDSDKADLLRMIKEENKHLLQKTKTQKDKLTQLEHALIEKDIKIEELQTDLTAASQKNHNTRSPHDDKMVLEENSMPQRSLTTPGRGNPAIAKTVGRQK